jgi:hypothetical protein
VRINFLSLAVEMAEDLFYSGDLFCFVVDYEVLFISEFLDVLPQNANAQGVESAYRGPLDLFAILLLLFRNQLGNAFLHFPCSFIGESNPENIPRVYAALDHVRDPESDDTRLAGSRAGEDQNRAFDRLDSLSLLLV